MMYGEDNYKLQLEGALVSGKSWCARGQHWSYQDDTDEWTVCLSCNPSRDPWGHVR